MSASKPGTILGLMTISVLIATAGLLYVRYVRPPSNVAYVSEEEGGIKVINLSTLQVVRGVQPADIAPRGIGITFDGKYLITANKNTSDIAIFGTPRLNVEKRIKIGDNPEFIKFDPAGDRVFATFEPGSSGGPPPAAGHPLLPQRMTTITRMSPPLRLLRFTCRTGLLGLLLRRGRKPKASNFQPTASR